MKLIQFTILLVFLIFFIHCDSITDCSPFFESSMKTYCENIYNDTHTCYYSKGKCELKSKGCNSYQGQDASICNSNVPTSNRNYYKCAIKDGLCTEVPKECTDYEEGISECEDLYAGGDSKRCVLYKGECKAHYYTCDILGANKETCEANIPSDETKECVWENDACQQKTKKCAGTELYDNYDCSSLTVTNSDKICLWNYDDDVCEEQYKTCDLYNEKSSNKNKKDCESIRMKEDTDSYFKFKCVFKDGTCSKGIKCEDFTYESGCKDFTPSDTNKKCSYNNGVCKEIYKTCDL